jgi:hypothetical protein
MIISILLILDCRVAQPDYNGQVIEVVNVTRRNHLATSPGPLTVTCPCGKEGMVHFLGVTNYINE